MFWKVDAYCDGGYYNTATMLRIIRTGMGRTRRLVTPPGEDEDEDEDEMAWRLTSHRIAAAVNMRTASTQ
jgi:hypothetical protein